MNTITDYKKRFFNLLESEMGDVKPLLNEQVTEEYFQKAVNDIVAFANAKVNEIKTKNPKSKVVPFSVERIPNANQNTVMYKIKWGVTPLAWNGDELALDIKLPQKNVVAAITNYFAPNNVNDPFGKKLKSPYYSEDERTILKTIQPQAIKLMNQAFVSTTATPTKQPVKQP